MTMKGQLMRYDFDTVVDRNGIHSVKWEVGPEELPMWVADMDFAVAPPIVEALAARASVPSFGYTALPDAWADAVVEWWQSRHAWTMSSGALAFCTGVNPAIASVIRTLTPPGGNVLVQTPVYNHFFSAITNCGRTVVTSPLLYDGLHYEIDWQDLEAKFADPSITLFVLCNPHNPTGYCWTTDELSRIGQLAVANGVVVVSDEIHCDITHPDVLYTPFALAAPNCAAIVCLSATKTFSIPGLQTSAVFVNDATLRESVFAGLGRDGIDEPSSFAVDAAIAAFTKGAEWVDEMRRYVQQNKDYAATELETMGFHVVPGTATYLLWVDCANLVGPNGDTTDFCAFLRSHAGLHVSNGAAFGGPRFFRLNVGCPRALVDEGLSRLRKGMAAWKDRQSADSLA